MMKLAYNLMENAIYPLKNNSIFANTYWIINIMLPFKALISQETMHTVIIKMSGLAVSRKNPGVIWTMQDSDQPNEVYALR